MRSVRIPSLLLLGACMTSSCASNEGGQRPDSPKNKEAAPSTSSDAAASPAPASGFVFEPPAGFAAAGAELREQTLEEVPLPLKPGARVLVRGEGSEQTLIIAWGPASASNFEAGMCKQMGKFAGMNPAASDIEAEEHALAGGKGCRVSVSMEGKRAHTYLFFADAGVFSFMGQHAVGDEASAAVIAEAAKGFRIEGKPHAFGSFFTVALPADYALASMPDHDPETGVVELASMRSRIEGLLPRTITLLPREGLGPVGDEAACQAIAQALEGEPKAAEVKLVGESGAPACQLDFVTDEDGEPWQHRRYYRRVGERGLEIQCGHGDGDEAALAACQSVLESVAPHAG